MSQEAHTFVFKLKCLTGSREDTRRYGFAGPLEQQAVFTGLYDRTAQVFSLVRGQFQLEFTPPSGSPVLLNDYDAFVRAVCQTTLSPEGLAKAKIDEKQRIVLHFSVKHGPPTNSAASQTESAAPELVSTPASGSAPAAAKAVHDAAEAVHDAAAQLERDIEAVVAETEKIGRQRRLQMEEVMAAQASANARAGAWAARVATPLSAGQADEATISYPSARFGPPGSTSPYQWSWSVPPPPPQVPLSHVPGAPGRQSRSVMYRELQEKVAARTAALMVEGEGGTNLGEHAGYRPGYVQQAPKSVEPVPVDGWAKTKSMLSTFVSDLNKHLADNFGDQAVGFELSVADENGKKEDEIKVEEVKPVEIKVEPTEPQAIHWGVVCDHCQAVNIKGVRHKCVDCNNYDLCTNCLVSAESFHPRHSYQAMDKPGRRASFYSSAGPSFAAKTVARAVNLAREAAQEVHRKANLDVAHPATCDVCNKTIKGVRHKCLNCPDWDSCSSCMIGIEATHPHHNFVKINHPSELKLKAVPQNIVAHQNIACDSCGQLPIVGPRFKCAHAECEDVDFCSSCVADPIARHPIDHPLLMLREPVKTKDVKACIKRVNASESSVGSSLPNDVRALLQSIGRSPSGKSTATSAEFVKGPGGEQTLIVDVDASELGLSDRDIHIPIAIPASSDARSVADEVASMLTDISIAPGVDADLAASAPDHESLIREAEEEGLEQEDENEEVESEAEAEEAPVVDKLDAKFIADVTIHDGSILPAGAEFHKVWAVVNSGTKAWPVGTRVVNVGGFSKVSGQAEALSFEVPAAAVGETIDIQAELKAPEVGGFTSDFWRLQDAEGNLFGHRLWVNVLVEDDSSAANSASSMSSSMIAPSLNAAGKTQSSLAPSVAGGASRAASIAVGAETATGTSAGTGASEFASVAGTEIRAGELESSDEDEDLSSDEDDESSEEESGEEYVVLTDEAALSSEDDF